MEGATPRRRKEGGGDDDDDDEDDEAVEGEGRGRETVRSRAGERNA